MRIRVHLSTHARPRKMLYYAVGATLASRGCSLEQKPVSAPERQRAVQATEGTAQLPQSRPAPPPATPRPLPLLGAPARVAWGVPQTLAQLVLGGQRGPWGSAPGPAPSMPDAADLHPRPQLWALGDARARGSGEEARMSGSALLLWPRPGPAGLEVAGHPPHHQPLGPQAPAEPLVLPQSQEEFLF